MITIASPLHVAAGTPLQPRIRRPVAVLVSRFPVVTETFVLRELCELERQGQPVLLVPLIRERPAVVHDAAAPWVRRMHYVRYFGPGVALSVLRMFRRNPIRLPRLLLRLVAASVGSPRMLLRTVALFPKAVTIAERLQAAGIRHVHAQFATHPATVALVVRELTGIPFSITAHAHDIFVDRALLRWKLSTAAFVRVISGFNARYLALRYPEASAGKLRVIHVGVDVRRSAGHPAVAEAVQSGRVLCVAALKPYKGLDVLIRACAVMKAGGLAFTCDVIGDGPLRASLRRAIAEADLDGVVRLLGALPETEVQERIGRASVVVQPSVVARNGQMEGIPVALMEAMAAGVPVVASALSGIPELVVDGETGTLVPPGDPPALAAALGRALEHPEEARIRVAAGRARVSRLFALDRTVAALLRQIDGFNPPVAPEQAEAVARLAAVTGPLGVTGIHEGGDARVLDLLIPVEGEGGRVVLKVARAHAGQSASPAERARIEYAALARLGSLDDPFCRAPRPLLLDEDAAAVLMEPCEGERLDHLVRTARASLDPRRMAGLHDALRLTGQWLSRFHHENAVVGEPGAGVDHLMARIEGDLQRVPRRLLSLWEARRVEHELSALARELRLTRPLVVGIHGDFWPGNVFVGRTGPQVIDFEGFRAGLPAEDLAWFLAHLSLAFVYPGLRTRRLRAARAFGAGYAPAGVGGDGAFRLCQAATGLALLARGSVLSGGPRITRGIRLRALRSMIPGLP